MGIRSQGQPTESYNDVWANTVTGAVTAATPASLSGLTATGGIISEYADPTGQKWVAHTFTAPGNFDITAKGSYPLAVDYFIVGGGAGGGGDGGGFGEGAGEGRTVIVEFGSGVVLGRPQDVAKGVAQAANSARNTGTERARY